MKEDKKVFLEVDCVEPVYNISPFSYSGAPCLKGIKVWIGSEGHLFQCDQYTVCEPDVVNENGRNQVRDLAIELTDMSNIVKKDLFGAMSVKDIFLKFPYEAIREKLDAWKKEKEEEKKIHVRDEVVNAVGKRFVVTVPPYMGSDSVKYFSGIAKDGIVFKDQPVATCKKTGLHVDDLDSYLEV